MRKIVFILWGNIKYDGRVQREIHTLRKNGYNVELILQNFGNDDLTKYDFKIRYFDFTPKSHPIRNFFLPFQFCRAAAKFLGEIQPDIVHCNDLNTLYAGYLHKKSGANFKLVYDAHELYPEQFIDLTRRIWWNVVEKRLLRHADEIILPEKNRASYFKKKYDINHVHLIENFPIQRQLPPDNYLEGIEPASKGKIKLLYIGAMFENRGIRHMVNAMPLLPEDYCLLLVGPVSATMARTLKDLVFMNGLADRIFILQPVENRNVINVINSADIGLVFYNNATLNDYYCASNKLYEFIVCSKYVVTNDHPGLKETVEGNGFGQCIDTLNSSAIAQAVSKIGLNGKKFSNTERFLWANQEQIFLDIYS